jgi:tRNA dimethylallyltransferase
MRKLVVILGTNASGKSDLGIRLARHFGGEIVSADSRQVYRGLDLGTGKITPAQAATVKHHLIDVADVSESYSLARYQQAAYDAIDSISSAGKLPLLVGGTGLYISAVVEGYQLIDVPPNHRLRAELDSLALPQLLKRLEAVDPDAAERIDRRNPRRIIRAIEIASAGFGHAAAQKRAPRYRCLQLGLTWPREILLERIDQRLRERLAGGMIEEVADLRSRGVSDFRLDHLGLEYRYIARHLQGEPRTLDDLRAQLGIAIRQFAKEQLTWFKRDGSIVWLDPLKDYFEEACQRIRDWNETQIPPDGEAGARKAFPV